MILLFGYFLYTACFGETTQDIIKERDLEEHFNGYVDSLYYEVSNHNVKIGVLTSGYKYQIFRRWEHNIEVGDSLLKKKGSFIVSVHKKNGKQLALDYRNTY